jgi:hypothetical protein
MPNSPQRSADQWARKKKNMETTEQIVREYAYHLWDRAGRPEELSMEFWIAAKAELDRIEDPLWVTEEAAAARRPRNLLEDNPASG